MAEIVPTILTDDSEIYRTTVESYNPFAKRVQIDISDGTFAPNQTIPAVSVWWPKQWIVDLHMMVASPSAYLPTLLKLHPSLVIFHAEVDEDLTPTFDALKNAGIKIGIAILKTTFPGKITETIKKVDHVMIFAGKLGEQGGTANFIQIEKAPIIKGINPNVEIGWDGGISLKNVRAIAHAGIDVLNVGKTLSSAPDKQKMYNDLVAEADRRGVAL